MATEDDGRIDETDAQEDDHDCNDVCHNDCNDVYAALYSIKASLDQLAENCCHVNDRINYLEMDCIDLLQPMGDIITLEKKLKELSEIESNYMTSLKKNNEQ